MIENGKVEYSEAIWTKITQYLKILILPEGLQQNCPESNFPNFRISQNHCFGPNFHNFSSFDIRQNYVIPNINISFNALDI